MIKECLNKLIQTKIDIGQNRKSSIKKYLDSYDEITLFNIMRTNVGMVAEDINIYYFPNIGFRCSNDTTMQGKLPVCNIIQRLLNEEYNSKINNQTIIENKVFNSKMDSILEKIKSLG